MTRKLQLRQNRIYVWPDEELVCPHMSMLGPSMACCTDLCAAFRTRDAEGTIEVHCRAMPVDTYVGDLE